MDALGRAQRSGQISRRQLLKGAATTATSLFVLGVACTPTAPAASSSASAAPAASSAASAAPNTTIDANYFKGQTIKVLVAGNPGGGVDASARLMSTYLEKYLPGNPKFVLTAMTGGAGIQVGNTLADRGSTRPDGLTIGASGPGLPVFQVSGTPGVAYDSTKLEWIGGTTDPDTLIYVKTSTGVTTVDQLKDRAEPIVFGAGPKTNPAFVIPELLRTDAGWNIRVIGGLGSTPEVFLAVERGDVQAGYENYSSLSTTKKEWIDNGTIKVIARWGTNEKALEGLPQITDFLPAEAKQIASMLVPGWGRPLVAPPGTPAEVLKAYRDAMAQMVADPQFQADAKKMGISTKLVSAAECLAIAQKIIATPPNAVQRYKQITQR